MALPIQAVTVDLTWLLPKRRSSGCSREELATCDIGYDPGHFYLACVKRLEMGEFFNMSAQVATAGACYSALLSPSLWGSGEPPRGH